MQFSVHGGKMLLVLGGGATAVVTDTGDSQVSLIAAQDSLLKIAGFDTSLGAYFGNGAAIEVDDSWLIESLRFLGYVVYKKRAKDKKQRGSRKAKAK